MTTINRSVNQKYNAVSGDNFSDIKKIINILLRNYYFFIIIIPLCVGYVIYYHRYTPEIYRCSVTMMFKRSSDRNISQSSLIEGIGLSSEMHNIENQSFIIKSNKMVRSAINLLDFEVSYYLEGRLKDSELYDPVPFLIKFDTLTPQLVNTPIKIKIQPDNTVRVSMDLAENGTLYNYSNAKNVRFNTFPAFDKTVNIGEIVEHSAFSFSVELNEQGFMPPQGNYYIIFNTYENLTSSFRSRLSVSNYREGSSIVLVSVTGTQPKKLIKFLDVFSENILENNLERKNDVANRSLNFIQKQLSIIADTLNLTQKELMTFRQNNHFFAPSEMSQRLSNEFYEKEKEKRLLDLRYNYFNLLKKRVETDDYDESDFLLPIFVRDDGGMIHPMVSEHMSLLKELQMNDELAGPNNPFRTELNKKILLSKETLIVLLAKQLETIEIQKKDIDSHISSLASQINILPLLEREYLEIERSYKLNDAIYTFLLQKNSETQISKASNVPDNEILDQPSITGIVSPNKKNNFTKAIAAGFLIPCIIIFFKEFFNVRIRRRDEIKHLFPEIPIIGNIFHNDGDNELVVLSNSSGAVAESFRSFRIRLKFFLPTSNEGKIISLSSTHSNEGKTFCAMNIASIFAMAGYKAIIAGYDMRKPKLKTIFNLPDNKGISNYLIDQVELDDIIYATQHENLFVIPSGTIPPNPSELIMGKKNTALLEELKSRFDYIILDTPPIGLVSDARFLIELSDCHLIVVRQNITHRERLIITVSNLMSENVSNIGILLNDLKDKYSDYSYYDSGYFG